VARDVVVSVRVPDEVKRKLKAKAKSQGITVSELVRRAFNKKVEVASYQSNTLNASARTLCD
jgi:predicted DNA-binding protein